jgi:hypothetical protein
LLDNGFWFARCVIGYRGYCRADDEEH